MKPDQPPLAPTAPPTTNPSAATGIVLSALGLAGWFVVLTIMLSIPYEQKSGDGQRDLVIGFGNVMLFFLRAAIGLVGLSVNGTLSMVGVVVSLVGLNYEPKRPAYLGIGLGVAGLALGAVLTIWRLAVFNLL